MKCIRINSGQQRVAVQAIGEANTIRSLASFRQSHEPTANEIMHRHNQIQQMISDDSVGVERQGGLVHYGVEDVFSAKPELANAVYEAIGLKINTGLNQNQYEDVKMLTNQSFEDFLNTYKELAIYARDSEKKGKLDQYHTSYIPMTKEEEALYKKDWKSFSKLRGFSEEDINKYSKWYKISGQEYNIEGAINDPWRRGLMFKNDVSEDYVKYIYEELQGLVKIQITPQQKQQALEQYSQYLDSIYPSSTTGLLFKGLRKKSKGHNTPNHSWYSSEYWISDRHYNDGTGVRIFVADTRSLAEHELNTPDGVTPAKQQEEDFINNSYHDAIMLDTEDIGGRQIQYAIRKDIKLHEIGTEQDIEGFRSFIQSQQQEQVEKNEVNAIDQYNNEAYNKKLRDSSTSNKFQIMLDFYQAKYPNLTFISETNESTPYKNKRAWIDNEGLHYNVDLITEDTLSHEIAEVFLLFEELNNKEGYDKIIATTKSIVNNNKEAQAIDQQIRSLGLNEKDHWNEVAATLLGLDSFAKIVTKLNEVQQRPLTVLERIAKFFNELLNRLRRDTSFYGKTINQYMDQLSTKENLTNSVLNELTSPRFQTVLNASINHGNDFPKRWNEAVADNKGGLNETAREAAKRLALSLKPKDGFYVINTYDGDIKIEDRYTGDALVTKIEEKYFKPKMEFEANFAFNVKEFLNRIKANSKIDIDKEIESIFGTQFIHKDGIKEALITLGVNPTAQVYLYSELSKSSNTILRSLYNNSFEYENVPTILIIHSDNKNTGEMEVSLFNVTTTGLGFTDYAYNRNNKALIRSIPRIKYEKAKGTWENDKGGMIKAMVALQLLSMQKLSGKKLKLRNGGVISISKKEIKNETFHDTQDMINNLMLIRDDALESVNNNSIKDVLNDNELFDPELYQSSWIISWALMSKDRMKDYVVDGLAIKAKMEDLILGKLTLLDVKEMMLARAMQLENSEKKDDLRELYLLHRAMYQADTGHMSYINKISDMSRMESLMVNTRNIRNDLLRWFVLQGEVAATSYKSIYKTWNDKLQNKLLPPLINKFKNQNNISVAPFYKDPAQRYYDNMFIRVRAKVTKTQTIDGKEYKAGDTYMAKLPLLYATQKDVTEKRITQEQLDLVNFIKESLDNALIQRELHELRKSNPKATIEEAKKRAKSLNAGDVFVIPKSINELFFSGEIKKAMNRYGTSLGFTEDASDVNYDKIINVNAKLYNAFDEQIRNDELRYEMMGLKRGYDQNGNMYYEVMSIEANNGASFNLERMLQSFMIENLRQEFYEREIIPRYNMAMGAMNFLEITGDYSLKNNKQFLLDLSDRTLRRKVIDSKEDAFDTPWGKMFFGKVFRSGMSVAAYSFLAYSYKIGTRSLVYNTINQWMAATSNYVADLGITVGEKAAMVTPEFVLKANVLQAKELIKGKLFNGELIRLAWKHGAILNSEKDLTSIWNRSGNVSNIFQDDLAHLMNAGTDIMARVIATAAIFARNGSLAAYTWNDEKGDFDYDITKDRIYADENGKITDEGMIYIYGENGLIDRLVEQKRMTLKPGQKKSDISLKEIPTGYDSNMIVRQVQYYADKYVLASINEWNKNLLASTYIGASASQYRVFSFEKAFNMGLFAGNRKTTYGTGYEIVEMDGKKYNREIIREIEGSIQSLAYTKQALRHMMSGDFLKWWNEQPAIRRVNIIRTMLKTTLAAMVYFGIKSIRIPEDEEYKYYWVMGDLGLVFLVKDFMENPIPILSYINTIIDGISGERDLSKVLYSHTPAKIISQFGDIEEFFSEYESQQE